MIEELLTRTKEKLDQTEGWDHTILDDGAPLDGSAKEHLTQRIEWILKEVNAIEDLPTEAGDFLFTAGIYFKLALVYDQLHTHYENKVAKHITKFKPLIGQLLNGTEEVLLYKIGLTYLRFKLPQPDVYKMLYASETKDLIDELNRLTGSSYKPSPDLLSYLGRPDAPVSEHGKWIIPL